MRTQLQGIVLGISVIGLLSAGPELAAAKEKGVASAPKPVSAATPGISADVIKLFGAYPVVKGATTRGVTADSIKIGVVSDITAGGQQQYYGGCQGAKARFDRANATRELKHRIDLVGCQDTGADPTKTDSLVKEMVESKKVFGLVSIGASLSSDRYLTDKKVPYVGWGVIPAYCGWDKPFGFGNSGALVCDAIQRKDPKKVALSSFIMAAYIAGTKKKPADVKVAIISEDNAAGRNGNPIQRRQVEAIGAKVVFEKASLPSTPAADYAPFIRDILKSNPNLVELSTAFIHVAPLAAGLRAAGYKGDILQFVFFDSGIFFVPQLAASIDTTFAATPGLGTPSFPGPGWVQAAADTKASGLAGRFYCDAAGPGIVNGCGLGFTEHYNSADFYVQALKALEKSGEAVTTENFVNLINAGWTYPGIPGMACPVTYPLGHVVGAPCGSLVQWDVANKKLKGLVDLRSYDLALATTP